jgi:hypothetical protein
MISNACRPVDFVLWMAFRASITDQLVMVTGNYHRQKKYEADSCRHDAIAVDAIEGLIMGTTR